MARAIVTVDENNNLPASVKGKLDTHYVPIPVGGSTGQVISKTDDGYAWSTVSGGGGSGYDGGQL